MYTVAVKVNPVKYYDTVHGLKHASVDSVI